MVATPLTPGVKRYHADSCLTPPPQVGVGSVPSVVKESVTREALKLLVKIKRALGKLSSGSRISARKLATVSRVLSSAWRASALPAMPMGSCGEPDVG